MPPAAVPYVVAAVCFFGVFMLTLGGAWIANSFGE